MKQTLWFLAVLVLLGGSPLAQDRGPGPKQAPLRVFVHERGFPPFDFGRGPQGEALGLYPRLMEEIRRRTGLDWVAVALPASRIYDAFRQGDVEVEVGVNSAWRVDEFAISAYTRPFAVDSNVLVYPAGKALSLPSALAPTGTPAPAVGTIRGYVYPSLEPKFRTGIWRRVDVNDERTLMESVAGGRLAAAVVTRAVAEYYRKNLALRVDFGAPFDALPLAIRIRKDRADLLPLVDQALASMEADGFTAALYREYQ